MSDHLNYEEINRQSWNARTEVHVDSYFYDMPGFLKGNSSLNPIELKLLGDDLAGKNVLHLQCHFGQDSISLARMGAKVTGVDLSDKSIEKAKELAAREKADASFICCNVYDVAKYTDQKFDLVFTSYGTIGWLPDLDKWAAVISNSLKPGGKLVFVEFHPVVWMFDNAFEKIAYNYFNSGAIIETETGSYTDRNAPIKQKYISWNHGISEVLNALIGQGLEIRSVDEFDYSPYNCFSGTVEVEPKKYRIEHLGNKIPMVYALIAVKK